MKVRLAYGESGLVVESDPARTTVVEPLHHVGAGDPGDVLRRALREPVVGAPLRERVRRGQTVAISACDGTRPQPRELMIPAVLAELDGVVDLDDVVVLVATGTHRGNSDAELRQMFGDEVVDSVRIVNHDGRDRDQLAWMGVHGNGVPVWLNRQWVDADVKITTGFVEPHFFAGFSGGPKLVAPGLAGLDTVLVLHDAARIGDPSFDVAMFLQNDLHKSATTTRVDALADRLGLERDRTQAWLFAVGTQAASWHLSCANRPMYDAYSRAASVLV
jgi:nickel-dependent lactate racemase